MMKSKIVACLLCLTVSAGAAGAQEIRPSNSDRLKKRIEIDRRALLRHYEEYASSLQKDIADRREIGKTLDDADAAAIKENEAEIERLTEEYEAAAEKAASLRGEEHHAWAALPPMPAEQSRVPYRLPCGCEAVADLPRNVKLPPGLIWCGREGGEPLGVQVFAELAAPILWFSPNEPLKNDGIPQPLPGDEDAGGAPSVYYRVSDIVLRPGVSGYKFSNADTRSFDLKSIEKLALKYYFYYSEDRGFRRHLHDLESVRLEVHFTSVEAAGVKYHVARIGRVIGAAHGVSWFNNELEIGEDQRDTSLPITLLVEEGKHATSPDRNADGSYSPGYDVNRRYNDAWGVRDLIGSGQVGSAKYEGSMTKPRRPTDMIMVAPAEADGKCLLNPYVGEFRRDLEAAKTRYRLARARIFETGEEQQQRHQREQQQAQQQAQQQQQKGGDEKARKKRDLLTELMEREKFREAEPETGHAAGPVERAAKFGLGIERGEDARDALTVGLRFDGQYGITISPPVGRYPVPVFGGYALPKMNFMFSGRQPNRLSVEGLYTPSVSRTFDWYVSAGSEWSRPGPGQGLDTRPVAEGGVRFRWDYKLLTGIRLGLRTTGIKNPRDPRLVFEFGTGAF